MSPATSNTFYVVGGTLPPEAPSYIERKADSDLSEHLIAGDFCYVLTSRQMGKSSLMARAASRLRIASEAGVAIVDLTQIGTEHGEGAASRWYYGISHKIRRDLGLDCDLPSWWQKRKNEPALQRLTEFFEDVVLSSTKGPLVIFVDEIDSTIRLPFAGDFFAAIRACYNQRAIDARFRRLTFVLLGVASPSKLIPDSHRTPFNIGYRIDLNDFSFEETRPLGIALPGSHEDRERQLRRVFFWTNGHPYLTQKALARLSALRFQEPHEKLVDDTISEVFIDPPLDEAERNIEDMRQFLMEQSALVEDMKALYRVVRSGRENVDDDPRSPVKSTLKLSGLLRVGRGGNLVVRNRIYERAFVDWEAGTTFYKIGENSPRFAQRDLPDAGSVPFISAKIVLVGDSGVGKTGLAIRLANNEFKETSSTHGERFWVLNSLATQRADGAECQAVLWDLAGQPDYRLIHSLFVGDADLALVVFDPANTLNPLHGVEYWLSRLRGTCAVILVAARVDRGAPTITANELEAFSRQHGLIGYVATSAMTGEGMDPLLAKMSAAIPWDAKPTAVTTEAIRWIRDHILDMKTRLAERQPIVSSLMVYRELQRANPNWSLTDAEVDTALKVLENYGYVKVLLNSTGDASILLTPELLNNLAASIVLEARRNPKGLGLVEEKVLLAPNCAFPELKGLAREDQRTLIESVTLLFLEGHVCFREINPSLGEAYLVFPELMTVKKSITDHDVPTVDDVVYTTSGAVENVYASLVALLGYTQVFTRIDQWHNEARYEMSGGLVCGFRQEIKREGEIDFTLYFGVDVDYTIRRFFQAIFEGFLARRNLTITRFEVITCATCGHPVDSDVVRARLRDGREFVFCLECGTRVALANVEGPIRLPPRQHQEVEKLQRLASQRSRFEQALFQLLSYVKAQKLYQPECFVSYAWGDPIHERWVEGGLARDLQKAGINVVLDRWENTRIGSSVARFVERVSKCDRIIVVGTPLYREKYEQREPGSGYVVASEIDTIERRLLGSTSEQSSVVPILLAGDAHTSLPPLLRGRVYADFRNEQSYFVTLFDLVVVNLYNIVPDVQALVDVRQSLRLT
jgi:small GTP-binding protein